MAEKNRTIMVVDDDEITLEFIVDHLKDMGQKVIFATDGSEALKIIKKRKNKPDLLLSDIALPGLNGVELAHSMFHESPDTKIILMSGIMQPALKTGTKDGPDQGFLKKPFCGKTLTSHIRKALEELESSA